MAEKKPLCLNGGVVEEMTSSDTIPASNIPNNGVTFARMQDIATDRLIGRDSASTGDPEEISVSGGVEFSGSGGIRRSALTGEVTASAGSNTTTLHQSAITNRLTAVPQLDDYILVSDNDDSGALKRVPLTNISNLIGGVPIGTVLDYFGTGLPANYIWCDGSAISRILYAELFAVIGTSCGAGDGSTTFNLPDLRGRASFGKDNMNNVGIGGGDAGRLTIAGSGVDGDTLGATGGAENHTLTSAESGVPAHTHPYVDRYQGTVDNLYANGTVNRPHIIVALNTTTSANTAADASAAHPQIPPAIVCNKIIRFES